LLIFCRWGQGKVTSLKPAPHDPNTFLIFRLFWKAFVAENEPMASATQVGRGGPTTVLLHANSCGNTGCICVAVIAPPQVAPSCDKCVAVISPPQDWLCPLRNTGAKCVAQISVVDLLLTHY
jgi:hypothetical protein